MAGRTGGTTAVMMIGVKPPQRLYRRIERPFADLADPARQRQETQQVGGRTETSQPAEKASDRLAAPRARLLLKFERFARAHVYDAMNRSKIE